MIIKRKLTKFPPEVLPLNEKGQHFTRVGADELISDTYKFLKTFYRGCFDAYLTRVGCKTLFLCIENFAAVLKGIVKAVFARELIIVRFSGDDDNLSIDMEFDTSFVSDEKRTELTKLANEGGFYIDFKERLTSIRLPYLHNTVPYVNSNSTRIVYNTLMYVFNNANI